MSIRYSIAKIREYWVETLKIADHSNTSLLRVLVKILFARVRYGLGIDTFKLYRLIEKPSSTFSDYMFNTELEPLQQVLISDVREQICGDKLLYYLECLKHKLPTPEVIGQCGVATASYPENAIPDIRNGEELLELLGRRGPGYYLFKPVKSIRGDGIFRIKSNQGSLHNDQGMPVEPDQLVSSLLADKCIHYILQPSLKPHPSLCPIMPGKELGTFRMVVTNRKRNPNVDYALAKVPVSGTVADNFLAGKAGNFIADINIITGQLVETLGEAQGYPGLIELKYTHPISKRNIPGFIIPQWSELLELVREATEKLDLITAGWDVAVTEQGPCLIEVNHIWDVEILQVSMGRGLKPDFTQKLASY